MAESSYPVGGDPVEDADPQRAMLAKLIAHIAASGNAGKYSPENLWALQGPGQFPNPPPDPGVMRIQRPSEQGRPDTTLPMRVAPAPDERFLRFPQQGDPKPGEGEAPFGGKGEVVGAYELPKKQKKDEKKKGKR